MFKLSAILYETSINRLVITSFIFVLLLPIGFFVYSLFQNSWQQVEQNILERHRLISTSLVEPFSLFISAKQQTVQAIGKELKQLQEKHTSHLSDHLNLVKRQLNTQEILDKQLRTSANIVALSYTRGPEKNLKKIVSTNKYISKAYWQPDYNTASFHAIYNNRGERSVKDSLSSAFKSTVTGKPVVLLRHRIYDENRYIIGTLFAEISLSNIDSMCSKINFGARGHCATIDHEGNLLSHPNKDWVQNIKNISGISVSKKMMAGESGTTEFYSPFLGADMVAGYSAIPSIGWGIMIPQPKTELTSVFDEIRSSILLWLLFGVLSAAVIAWKLADEITKPINLLMQKTHLISKTADTADLGEIPNNSPREIKKLWSEFSNLLKGLKHSHDEVDRLNKSLHVDVARATYELRQKNKKLYELSTLDYLTSLPNRRYFTDHLNKQLESDENQQIGVIFIDMDHFKSTNDTYGHEVGDAVLVHLGELLNQSIRKSDIAARLGGDEFVIFVDDANELVLAIIAEKIRQAAVNNPLMIQGHTVNLSLSLGTVSHMSNSAISAKDFFRLADQAMYASKGKGRNAITHYNTSTFNTLKTMAG